MSRNLRSVLVFLVIAFGLSWLIALPLWLGEGLGSPLFPVIAIAMMATPAIAALVVVFFVEKPERKAVALGIRPVKPVGRLVLYSALGLVLPIALVLAALPVGALLGVYPADFDGLSAFRVLLASQFREAGVEAPPIPAELLLTLQIVSVVPAAFINLIPALGEELGWRGWLLPKLMPLGVVPALLVSGVIWGLWHAPLLLLGYNYPTAPGWLGVLAMCGMCIVIGAVFAWLRIRSASVWPAALAHGAFNAVAGASFLFAQAGRPIDTTQATILGWSGWIVPAVLVVVLLVTGGFRAPSRPVARETAPAAAG